MRDPLQREVTFERDLRGRVKKQTKPDGTFRRMTYHPDGQLATQADELGRTTSFEVDGFGRVTAITDPRGTRSSSRIPRPVSSSLTPTPSVGSRPTTTTPGPAHQREAAVGQHIQRRDRRIQIHPRHGRQPHRIQAAGGGHLDLPARRAGSGRRGDASQITGTGTNQPRWVQFATAHSPPRPLNSGRLRPTPLSRCPRYLPS